MDGWWSEIGDEIVGHLRRHGELTPSELGRRLGEPPLDLVERLVRQPQRAADHARARVDLPDRARVLAGRPTDADAAGALHRASLAPGRAAVSYGAR